MKRALKGKGYDGDEEVKIAIRNWLKQQPAKFYGAMIHAAIRSGTLPLKEVLTMSTNRDANLLCKAIF